MEQFTCITTVTEYLLNEITNIADSNLITAAQQAAKNAYAPYSRFMVGAAVLLSNNQIVTGNNQENAAFPSGLCAERVAMFYANAKYPNELVKTIAITAQTGGNITAIPVSPCGACRQVLLETEHRFGTPIKIILAGNEKIWIVETAKQLLPIEFGKQHLSE